VTKEVNKKDWNENVFKISILYPYNFKNPTAEIFDIL
jgi:hypothetical protein